MKSHPATQFKRNYKEIIIPDLCEDDRKPTIGRRTGRNMDDHVPNGDDFLLKNDESVIPRAGIYDLYVSDSSSSSSSENNSDSSWESEAEETSVKEEQTKSKEESDTTEKKNTSQLPDKNKIEEKYKQLGARLIREPLQIELHEEKENKVEIIESDPGVDNVLTSPNYYKSKQTFKEVYGAKQVQSEDDKNKDIHLSFASDIRHINEKHLSDEKKVFDHANREKKKISFASDLSTIKKKDRNVNLSTSLSDSVAADLNEINTQKKTDTVIEEKSNEKKLKKKTESTNMKKKQGNRTIKEVLEEDHPESLSNKSKNQQGNLDPHINLNLTNFQPEVEVNENADKKKKEKNNKKKRTFKEMNEKYSPEDQFGIKSKKKLTQKSGRKIVTEGEYLKKIYDQMTSQLHPYLLTIDQNNNEEKYFGENNRYSKRVRIPRLNHLAGERITYQRSPCGGYQVKNLFALNTIVLEKAKMELEIAHKKPRKKKLVKGLNRKEEKAEDDLPENYKEVNGSENDGLIIILPGRSKKAKARNFNVVLKGEVKQSTGENMIKINEDVLDNLVNGDTFQIPPLAVFEIKNYSQDELRIALIMQN